MFGLVRKKALIRYMKEIKDENRASNIYAKYPPKDNKQEKLNCYSQGYEDGTDNFYNVMVDIIRKHMNDGWISVEERLPDNRRSNYEVTFINECGYEEHGFSQWYDGEFHIPAVVIAWREHLKPYRPERRMK